MLAQSIFRTRATITRLKGAIEAGQVKRFRRPTIVFAEMDERIAIPALLNRALPKASYLHPEDSQARTSTRSQEEHKIPIPDELPTRIAKWTAFPREAQNWVDGVCLGSDHLTLPGYLGRERLGWKVSCEFDVYYHLQFVLLEPLTEISRRGHIVTLPRFLNYGSLRGSGIKIPGGLPDVSIYKGDELLSVMKVKEKLFLNSKDGQLYDLVTVDGLADRKCSSKVSDDYVREVLNFIEANGLSYGILCSDVDFYFLWWERSNKTLHISASQTHDQVASSVLACCCYLMHRANNQRSIPTVPTNPFAALLAPIIAFVKNTLIAWVAILLSSHSLEISRDLMVYSHSDFLGAGGTGEVYAARFLGFIPVALKLAPWEGTEPTNGVVLTADEEIREEIKVYQALSGSPTSSCIPRLISHGYLCSSHQGRRRYLAISLLKGLSMRKAAMQLSSLEDAILLSRQAFSSLLLFHKSGAAHHSVSSRNLLVDSSLKVWLLDLASAEVGASQRAMRDDFNSMARALFSSLEGMGCLSKSEVEEAVQRGQDVYEEGMLKSKTS